jgi:hypothetical protein
MASRGNIQDFVNAVNAKSGYSVSVNADGSLKISGSKNYPTVFWNIQQTGAGMAGPASSNGSTPNTTSTGLCQVVYSDRAPYSADTCTIMPDGASGSGA